MKWSPAISSLAGTAIVIACTSSTGSVSSSPCSNGPTYSWDSGFSHSTDTESHPKCTPHCGSERESSTGTFPVESLPSGECSDDGEVCSMTIRIYCCNDRSREGGPVHVMRCSCGNGTWTCAYSAQGAASCRPCSDGGLDAASD